MSKKSDFFLLDKNNIVIKSFGSGLKNVRSSFFHSQ
jgi:hypothetical protein